MKRLTAFLAFLLFATAAAAGNYIGDYALGDTIDCKFGTVQPSTGASFTLAGTPVISAYVDNSTTQITAGITLSADFDGVTGLNNARVVATAANGYTSGTNVALVITTGTVDSVSVTGQPVCSFSLRKVHLGTVARGLLSGTHDTTTADLGTNAPGATSQVAGMTLVIPAKFFSAVVTSYNTGTGVATFSPATALTLANDDAWELWPTPSSVFATDSINAAALSSDAGTELGTAMWATTTRQLTGTQTFNVTGNITGNLSGSVGSVTTVSDKTGYALSASGLNAITLSEPSAKPAWTTGTFPQFLAWLALPTMNEVQQTSSTKTIRNDANDGDLFECAVSDDGTTFTLEECATP